MSLERAYKNCMACYQSRQRSSEDLSPEEVITDESNIHVRYFMNNALQGLEQALYSHPRCEVNYPRDESEQTCAISAIKACAKCDFSKPKIAEIVGPVIGIKKKEAEEKVKAK